MKRIINFRDFNVFAMELEEWEYGYHKHNFYELILIESGRGKQRLNDITFPYRAGDVFLLLPSDAHEFFIEKRTRFLYIKFTEQYIPDVKYFDRTGIIRENIDRLLTGRPVTNQSMVSNKEDTISLFKLAGILLNEFSRKTEENEALMRQLFMSMLLILTRNIIQCCDKREWLTANSQKIESIISYLNVHALDKNKMKIKNLASEFAMSGNYFSIYVKKHTGLSIQQHLLQYRLKAAQKLLRQSGQNINEIAERLGFTDASHFNRTFKKHSGMSPLVFRRTNTGKKRQPAKQ